MATNSFGGQDEATPCSRPRELEKARKALAGNLEAEHGALRMIPDGTDGAAIAFLQQVADRLRAAGAADADTATLVALLEQVVAALSAP